MRTFVISLLLLLSAGTHAGQALQVRVTWGYSQGGRSFAPPAGYLAKLTACGVTPRGAEGVMNDSVLFCQGILDFSEEFVLQAKLTRLLDRLVLANVKRVGQVDIAVLKSRVKSIRIGLSKHLLFYSFADTHGSPRNTAVNIAEKNLIILNLPMWALFMNSNYADLLLLHELLGAVNIDDGNYQATLAIWWMSMHTDRVADLSARLKDLIELRAPVRVAGTTIVGHGGDPGQLLFKASLLDASTRKLDVPGVPMNALPTRTDMEEAIILARISSVPANKLKELGICVDGNGARNPLTCGGFALKGNDGKPFILMAEEWGQTQVVERQYPLLYKVIGDVIRSLICDGGKFRCG